MVVVFYGVAGLMVVAGLASLVQGLPYVRLEVGWTMVIAGTVAASAGVLLAGVAAVLGRLGHLERALRAGPVAGPPAATEASVPAAAPVFPVTAASGASSGAPDFALDFRPTLDASAPASDAPPVELPPEPRVDSHAEPRQPDLPGFADLPAGPRGEGAEAPAGEGSATGPSTGPASVIGTYSSGGNGYVMFSDGSIEAETPRGRYRFGSIDELKAFIAAGGEDGPAGVEPPGIPAIGSGIGTRAPGGA